MKDNTKAQLKYEECVKLLTDIHDIIATTLALTPNIELSAKDLIVHSITAIEEDSKTLPQPAVKLSEKDNEKGWLN